MPFRVYRMPSRERARLDAALADDQLSRQSITLRDARHFGEPGDTVYVFVEGTEGGMLRADALLLEFAERAPDAERLHGLLKQEEDEAASSLGAILGDL